MKQLFHLIMLLLCNNMTAQTTGQVSFSYDLDGNMEHRLVIIVPSQVKSHNNPKDTVQMVDLLGEQKLIIYPNPTKGIFQVSINTLDIKANNYFILYSLTGSQLMNQHISDCITSIDISNYPAGAYLMNIILGDKVSKWKVIKQ